MLSSSELSGSTDICFIVCLLLGLFDGELSFEQLEFGLPGPGFEQLKFGLPGPGEGVCDFGRLCNKFISRHDLAMSVLR